MLKLEEYKVIFTTVGLVGILIFASPILSSVLKLPGGERFSELWILGPDRMAEDYPFNVRAGEDYLVYIGIGNHMGSPTYYAVYVKFRNQSEPLPNSTVRKPSPLPALYEFHVFLLDGEIWEAPLTFSFTSVSISANRSLVETLRLNNVTFAVEKAAFWNDEDRGYYYQMFFELWIYDANLEEFQFHNRFVGIWLNMTA